MSDYSFLFGDVSLRVDEYGGYCGICAMRIVMKNRVGDAQQNDLASRWSATLDDWSNQLLAYSTENPFPTVRMDSLRSIAGHCVDLRHIRGYIVELREILPDDIPQRWLESVLSLPHGISFEHGYERRDEFIDVATRFVDELCAASGCR